MYMNPNLNLTLPLCVVCGVPPLVLAQSAAGRYTDMMRMMCRFNTPIADACPAFRLPEYTPPSQCPPVEQTLARLQSLTPLASTEYHDCTVP